VRRSGGAVACGVDLDAGEACGEEGLLEECGIGEVSHLVRRDLDAGGGFFLLEVADAEDAVAEMAEGGFAFFNEREGLACDASAVWDAAGEAWLRGGVVCGQSELA